MEEEFDTEVPQISFPLKKNKQGQVNNDE